MTAAHPLPPEQVMAYLDGEVTHDQARDIQAHLAVCGACQQLAADLREGSSQIREWQIEEPPVSLAAPRTRNRTNGQRSAWMLLGSRAWRGVASRPLLAGAAVVVVLAGVVVLQPSREAPSVAASSVAKAKSLDVSALRVPEPRFALSQQGVPGINTRPDAASVVTGPRIVRTATLRLVATDFDRIRPAVDRILQSVGGFVGGITAFDRPGAPRSIRGTLRVPSPQFDSVLAALRALGRVTEDSQDAEDVTATEVDLDVRLANARVTEKRLSQVLQNRTGGVSDVLEVEREIARVRTEIEQMESQRKQLDQRIEYATLTLEIVEERAAAVNLGPVPIPARLRHAIADGVESAAMSMLEAVLFALRAGPALLLWTIVLGLPAWLLVRRYAARPVHRPGGV